MAASRSDGPWDSALSVDAFAAVRSVGFEPVGQVFGAAVYYLATVAGVSCPGTTAESYPLPGASAGISGDLIGSPPARVGDDYLSQAAKLANGLHEGRRTAIDRMASECADRGGHGVVGAAVEVAEIASTSFTAAAIKFTAIGTAVRASGCPPLARPFTSELCGPDFAKLIMADWVPAGIALGISVAGLHDEMATASSGPWGTGNAEVPAYTGLITAVRQNARDRLEQSVRELGADGVVVSGMTLRVRTDPCHAHAAAKDHFAEAVTTGSAITRFAGRNKTTASPSLAVMHLDADARQRGPTSPSIIPLEPAEARRTGGPRQPDPGVRGGGPRGD